MASVALRDHHCSDAWDRIDCSQSDEICPLRTTSLLASCTRGLCTCTTQSTLWIPPCRHLPHPLRSTRAPAFHSLRAPRWCVPSYHMVQLTQWSSSTCTLAVSCDPVGSGHWGENYLRHLLRTGVVERQQGRDREGCASVSCQRSAKRPAPPTKCGHWCVSGLSQRRQGRSQIQRQQPILSRHGFRSPAQRQVHHSIRRRGSRDRRRPGAHSSCRYCCRCLAWKIEAINR